MKTLTVSNCKDCPFAFTHCKEVSKSGIKEGCPLITEDVIITVAEVLKGWKNGRK